jgi:7-cyano-7-deazaguanine synthase
VADKAVVVLSGGMDSATLLWLAARYYDVYCISFDYGQKHSKELDYAARLVDIRLGDVDNRHTVVDLTSATACLNSSLTNPDWEVPEGHYAADNMKQTVVPNRNMIMASIAAGYATSIKAVTLAVGVHAGDHAVYPDCRPKFWHAFEYATVLGNEGFIHGEFYVWTPFLNVDKTAIAKKGGEMGVPYEYTWSCYKGGRNHCGKCGTCVERREAFKDSGLIDPTVYEN